METGGVGATKSAALAEVPRRPHVAMLPSPGMGHLIPMAAMARRLVADHGFEVTFLLTDTNPKSAAYVRALPAGIHVDTLPVPDLDDVPPGAKIETIICLTVVRSLPAVRASLARITNLAALVVDLFATDAFDTAWEVGAAAYVFYPPNATVLSLFLHVPELDRKVRGQYRDMPDPLRLPGCVTVQGEDLLDPIQDRHDEAYRWLLRQCSRYPLADGVLVNSFEGIEPGPIKALREKQAPPTVYPVGPLVTDVADATARADCPCMRWLDEQPAGSVMYVSFGSGGILSAEQMEELAAGLEMSHQRFLWVARPPANGAAANAAFFNSTLGAAEAGDALWFIPQGFRDRTKGMGLVVPSWAPQVAVLAHEATGGFLTHCGWNSVLEASVHGVPLIAWPLYAEQRMNAVLLSQEVGNAIRPVPDQGGIVRREEVCRVVKTLMEGQEGKRLRSAARRVQQAAQSALADGGATSKAITEVAAKWKAIVAAKTSATAPPPHV